jgi:leucyl aminopeptidase (aminopeptidase T)
MAALIQAQMRRGAEGSLRWMSTLFPTPAYAMEAGMGVHEYQDFFYRACHADDDTPTRWRTGRALKPPSRQDHRPAGRDGMWSKCAARTSISPYL